MSSSFYLKFITFKPVLSSAKLESLFLLSFFSLKTFPLPDAWLGCIAFLQSRQFQKYPIIMSPSFFGFNFQNVLFLPPLRWIYSKTSALGLTQNQASLCTICMLKKHFILISIHLHMSATTFSLPLKAFKNQNLSWVQSMLTSKTSPYDFLGAVWYS